VIELFQQTVNWGLNIKRLRDYIGIALKCNRLHNELFLKYTITEIYR
jgi:hypothetical protein